MKLEITTLNIELRKLMDEDGIGPEELSNKTGVSKATIYSIINEKRPSVQRFVARKIAEGTGRKFKIEGDKIYFFKPDPALPEEKQLSDKEIEMVEMFRNLDEDTQRTIIELIKIRAMKTKTN